MVIRHLPHRFDTTLIGLAGTAAAYVAVMFGGASLAYGGPGDGCLITAVNQQATVRAPAAASREGKYLVFEDCAGIRIEKGEVTVYFRGPRDQPPRSAAYTQGQTVEPPARVSDPPADAGWSRMILTAFKAFGGRETTPLALSRAIEDTAFTMFPTGRILPPDAVVTIDFVSADLPRLDRFTLGRASGTRATLVALENVTGRIDIPAALLSPGLDYVWSAVAGPIAVQRTFRVVSRDDAAAAAGALAELPAAANAAAATVERAIVLQQLQFEYDSGRLFRTLARGETR